MRKFLVLVAASGSLCLAGVAERQSLVDGAGVLRWRDDGSEIALFGVNYYTPFTVDYEGIAKLGLDHRGTIRHDVAHFQQLGLDVIRLHVFDRQISDETGNLLANEHLDLFDYLVGFAKQRGIYTVLTPIAWWPYHVREQGFSSLYSMPEMVLDPDARKAQCNYLRQFMQHVNPYTKRAYSDEPAVVAIELINEPLYSRETTHDQILEYIEALAQAVRSTGAEQPIFYNGWQGTEDVVGRSSIEGCTFGWYPSGLVSGGCLYGNHLPAVDDYPRMRLPCLAKKAKIVYEFDAADVPGRVMYPAMARAFRSGGAQIATQFQYEPLPLGPYNYGWQTHYLNLVYTPGKAASFAIAAEVFRRLPRLAQFGKYPGNTTFGPCSIDFSKDLSVLRTDQLFMHSNDTDERPADTDGLTRIVGCGSSPLVSYDGTGAYFLDQVSAGVWRLDVYPDAVWVADPHAATSLDRTVSQLVWCEHPMTVRLADLGSDFRCYHLKGGDKTQTAFERTVLIQPGAYLLRRSGVPSPPALDVPFHAPDAGDGTVRVWWKAPTRWRAGVAMPVEAIVAARDVADVWVNVVGAEPVHLRQASAYRYAGVLPADLFKAGTLEGRLAVRTAQGVQYYPPTPRVADELLSGPWILAEVEPDTPVPVPKGAPAVTARRINDTEAGCALQIRSDGFDKEPSAAGFRLPATACPRPGYNKLVVRARAIEPGTDSVEVGFVQRDGKAFGTNVPLWSDWQDVRVGIDELRPLWGTAPGRLDVAQLAEVSFVFGAWLYGQRRGEAHGFEIQRVSLAHTRPAWRVEVSAADGPVQLFVAGERPVRPQGQEDRAHMLVAGSRVDRKAVRVWTKAFGAAPSCISFRQAVPDGVRQWQDALASCDVVRIVARSYRPETRSLEVVLVEQDSSPWGTVIKLEPDWRETDVPLAHLRFFHHWRHPEGRGGEGDRLRPGSVSTVNFCFGAWLFGDEAGRPHGIEVERVELVRR